MNIASTSEVCVYKILWILSNQSEIEKRSLKLKTYFVDNVDPDTLGALLERR